MVQKMPDRKNLNLAMEEKEERSYIHLVSPSHAGSSPPSLFRRPGGLDGNLRAVWSGTWTRLQLAMTSTC